MPIIMTMKEPVAWIVCSESEPQISWIWKHNCVLVRRFLVSSLWERASFYIID